MKLLMILILMGVLTACGSSQAPQPAGPTPLPAEAAATPAPSVAEPTPLPSATSAPVTEPTAEPTETATASFPLPASLYLLSGPEGNMQIWRIAEDGATTTQITDEASGVNEFDVSPVDGSLVYIAGEELVRSDGEGSNRQVLFTDTVVAPDGQENLNTQLSAPRWSPDGQQIAFGFGGVNLIPAGGGEVQPLLQSSPYPDMNAGWPSADVRFYMPDNWSPDGTMLLVQTIFYPEGGEHALFDLATNELRSLGNPTGLVCCNPAWSPDSSTLYLSAEGGGYNMPGLAQINPESGEATLLLSGDGFQTFPPLLAIHVQPAAEGMLYGWFKPLTGSGPEELFTTPYQPGRAPLAQAGEVAGWQALNPISLRPMQSLWARDFSGVVTWPDEGMGFSPTGGSLFWVPLDGSEPLPLPLQGRDMRWGP